MIHPQQCKIFNKPYIKIILTYEEYFVPEILHYVYSLKECHFNNDGTYWLVPINEMEMFLYLYKTNPALFSQIVEKKIIRERNSNHEGTSIITLLFQNGITKNEYIHNEEFQYYRNLAKNTLIESLAP